MYRMKGILFCLTLALAFGLLALNCSSEKSTEPDTRPPAAIANLASQAASCDSATLTWTAPGDDSSSGRAASYDIRRSAASITEVNWASATQLAGEPAPRSAGGSETFGVGGLTAGVTYYFAMKTRDDSGNESALSNVCSMTPGVPVIAWVKDGVGDDQAWSTLPSTLSANWALDACANSYEYAIGTTAGATNVVAWTAASSPPGVTRSGLSLADGQTYYFSVRGLAGSQAGNPASSNGVTVDLTAPSSSVGQLPSLETVTVFSVSWTGSDATSGIASYDIEVRTGADGSWGPWLAATALTSSDFTGVNGQAYYFRSRARDRAGNVEDYPAEPDAYTTVSVGGIPQVAWVRDGLFGDANWTNSTTSLSAAWAPAAGDGYEYAIGTTAGGNDVVDWTSAGTATQATRTGLSLIEGQTCYFSVRVTVGAAHGNAASSDGITVDITLPTSSINPLPAVTTAELFDITWSGNDALSGIHAYNIQYKDGDGEWGDIYGWNPATSFDGFQGEDGHTYYFRSRAMDNAGNIEDFPDVPDAMTAVNLPVIPDIAWVHDGPGADVDWSGGTAGDVTLSANWASAPGVDGYEAAIGTAPGDTTILRWSYAGTDTFLSMWEFDGPVSEGPTYYISVRGIIGSRQGDSTSSDGVRLDLTPPTSQVASLPPETNTEMFTVSWSGADTPSGVKSYTIRVVDGDGSGEYQDWLVGTTQTSAYYTGEDGHNYYFKSQATDSAGNVEPVHAAADAWTTVRCAYVYGGQWGSAGTGNGEFDQPVGLAVDRGRNVLVADSHNNRIQKFSAVGVYQSQFGSYGVGNGQLARPWDVAIDDSGYIYVTENQNHRVQKFTSAGTYSKKWGTWGAAEGQFSSPGGIDVDGSGNVYVADLGNHRVQKFTSKGVFLKAWGDSGSGPGQFSKPYGLAVYGSSAIYVSDFENNNIQKFDAEGTRIGGWGTWAGTDGQFNHPTAIAVDAGGYMYVADTYGQRILKFTSDGDFVAEWGSWGTGDGQFQWPQGITAGGSGQVYTTEPYLNRVQRFHWSCP